MKAASLISLSLLFAPAAYAAGQEAAMVPAAVVAPPVVPAPSPASAAAANDPVLFALDAITVPDWTAEPARLATNLAEVPIPAAQSAAILQEYKITSVIHKRFLRTQRAIDVLIYNFADGRSAFGAYSALHVGSSNIVVRGDLSTESDQYICFLKGTRFVSIVSSVEEDQLSKNAASVIADQLASRIDEHANQSAFFHVLPVLDRMHGTERIFMGPVATRKFMPIPFIPTLRLNESRGAAFADYQFPHPEPDRAKTMVIEYGDSKLASAVYEAYSAQVGPLYKSRMLGPTVQLSKTDKSWLLCGQSGTRVFIVAGAKRKISPMMLARVLAGN
jgi:hypothetical protein